MAKSIPSKIAKALISIQKSIDVFFNDSRNNHQSFNYVSIDAYYQQIRPLLNEHELIFLVNEVDAKATADTQVVKIQYELSILHVDGDIWETGLNRHIYVQYRNATSCGSALSYAEKNFFRTLFKIPTGEKMEKEEAMLPDSDPDGHKQPTQKKSGISEPQSPVAKTQSPIKLSIVANGKPRQVCTDVNTYMKAMLELDASYIKENSESIIQWCEIVNKKCEGKVTQKTKEVINKFYSFLLQTLQAPKGEERSKLSEAIMTKNVSWINLTTDGALLKSGNLRIKNG